MNWTVVCKGFLLGGGAVAFSPRRTLFAPSCTRRFPSPRAGARVDTASHGGGPILRGLGCWLTVG